MFLLHISRVHVKDFLCGKKKRKVLSLMSLKYCMFFSHYDNTVVKICVRERISFAEVIHPPEAQHIKMLIKQHYYYTIRIVIGTLATGVSIRAAAREFNVHFTTESCL